MIFPENARILITEERAYQDAKWDKIKARPREVGTWITLMDKFLNDAKIAYASAKGDGPALNAIRKVAALAVACMEQHEEPARGTK